MENNQTDINVLIKRRYEELDELKKKGIESFAYSFDTDTYSETSRIILRSMKAKMSDLPEE